MDEIRVVFVELVASSRFIAGMFLPFAKGLLQSRGASVRWIRLAVPADEMLDAQGAAAGRDEEIARIAGDVVREAKATHVVLSHVAGVPLAERLRAARPLLRLGLLDDDLSLRAGDAAGGSAPDLQVLAPTQDSLFRWAFGAPGVPAGEALLDFAEPDFHFEPGNPAAGRIRPFVYLFAGPLCTYRRSLAESLFFAGREGVDLPERWGCSFCSESEPTYYLAPGTAGRALQRLENQLAALRRTFAFTGGPLRVLVIAANVAQSPTQLARLVDEASLPPCHLLLSYRADEIAGAQEALRAAAQRLAQAGHRLDVNLVGVESFSARQLDRYHKGYGPEANVSAVRALRGLEQECPESFGFSEYGGLSTILYDPWTTPGEVALNLAVVRHFGLFDLCGKLLTSRLRLIEGLPLTQVARQEGLVRGRHHDPLLDTARRNFYGEEIPWVFADSRLDALNRVTTRLETESDLEADPLGQELARWKRTTGLGSLAIAEILTRIVAGDEEALEPQVLLRRGMQESERPPATPEIGAPNRADPVVRWLSDSWEYAALCAGAKPVAKIEEELEPGLQERLVQELGRRFPDLAIRARERAWDEVGTREVFLGRDAQAVDEAMQLTELRDGSLVDRDRIRAALERTGVLLGYPECCARAFAAAARVFQNDNGWLILKRRLEVPGPVSPAFNPALMPYVPCSLRCGHTAELVARVNENRPDCWGQYGDWPTLVFLGPTVEIAVLEPSGPVEVATGRVAPSTLRMTYARAIPLWLTAQRRQTLERGDVLEIEPGLLRVLRGDREVGFFALEAFLWSCTQVFHREFWAQCVRELEEQGERAPTPEAGVERGTAATEGRTPVQSLSAHDRRRRELLAAFADALTGSREESPHRWHGFVLESIEELPCEEDWGELVLSLRRESSGLVASLFPARQDRECFARSERYAISHRRETPADTADKQRVLRFLLEVFDRAAGSG